MATFIQLLQTFIMTKKILFIAFFFLLNQHLFAGTHDTKTSYPIESAVPGGVVIINLSPVLTEKVKAYFSGKRVLVRKTNNSLQAVIGLPLKIKSGIHKIKLVSLKGKTSYQEFSVHSKDYETRHITIKNKRMVSPKKEDIARHYKEKPLMLTALKTWTENKNIQTNFIHPVDGRFSSIFGLNRIYNKQKRIRRHTGLDIAAPVGTAIISPARGTVIRTGSYFFTGNTVFIDHGQGLVTMYCHLNKTIIKAGQKLEQGQKIGTVGMTGRVSGPHLHWVVSLNNTKVDPKLFIKTDVAKR